MNIYFVLIVLLLFIQPLAAKGDACDSFTKGIIHELEALNSCKEGKDCFITSFGCPYGCYNLLNKEKMKDLLSIREKIDKRKECGNCKYDCDVYPKPQEIKCLAGKCVHQRPEAK
ncbi:MAG: hypothetical protein WCG27_07315 [Pseudomonadota bacterium]